MKLLVATTNAGKLNEFKEILKDYFEEILSYNEIGQVIDIEETGSTFQQNAKKKAIEAAKATGYITLADDSGLVVDALNGLPGVYSARCLVFQVKKEQLDLFVHYAYVILKI